MSMLFCEQKTTCYKSGIINMWNNGTTLWQKKFPILFGIWQRRVAYGVGLRVQISFPGYILTLAAVSFSAYPEERRETIKKRPSLFIRDGLFN